MSTSSNSNRATEPQLAVRVAPYSILEQIERHDGPIKVPTLAKIFGVSRKTIYEMMKDQRIPTIDVGLEEKKLVDPKTLAYTLRKRNPMMREAARQG